MKVVLNEMQEMYIENCVDIYIDTFQREPWKEVFENRDDVIKYFNEICNMDSFIGYIATIDEKIVALCMGIKKPWIGRTEYYIDEFCVRYDMQRKGIGSEFLKKIEESIKLKGLNGMLLNTDVDYSSYDFYVKNGFKNIKNLVILGKN